MSNRKKVLFVCSAGGHLAQILEMKVMFDEFDYLIVTENIEANHALVQDFNIQFVNEAGKGRDLRFWLGFIFNFFIALKTLLKFRPNVIISTGSHTAIPFCLIGKVFRSKIVFILSFARIKSRSKAASIIHPIADEFIVQWESAVPLYSKAKFLGGGLY